MSNDLTANKCWAGNCRWREHSQMGVACSHPKKKSYKRLKEPCPICDRKPNQEHSGCGACFGRGVYVYPHIYEDCDCGGYEQQPLKKKKSFKK